ncbi:amidohydrolase family protein [Brenneria rubrifaciens]|uniref:Amidohydrolase n=1 Tax=Brenneria rubrifaciens TaxID=55213 RepID=A0A4P8QWD9_9GAMM|nr:amidohydrolase family protein [Brenneria rubrifaciens]QCR09809.1 amidohydrolase [Brenneria rubrifaciens]
MIFIKGGELLNVETGELERKDILIIDGIIANIVLPGMDVPPQARIVPAENRILHAGLINSHTHGHGNLSRGMGDRWTLELLLTAGPWMSGHRTNSDKYLTTLIGAAEMLLKGCTACYDLTYEFPCPSEDGLEASKKAYKDAGMRAVIAPMIADLSFFEAIPGLIQALPQAYQSQVSALRLAPGEQTFAALGRVLKSWGDGHADGIKIALAPTIPHHCSDEFLMACKQIAGEYGLPVHSHVAESKIQAVTGMKKYAGTLTQHLERLGLISADFTVAHGVWLDDGDMQILGRHGASVAHNPGSNMILGSGLADVRAMLNAQINVGIGTDGSNCSDNQNMYEAMRMASMVSNVRTPEWYNWLTPGEIFKAATVGSAKALGLEKKIGKLAEGYYADIVFLDKNSINLIPINNIINSLVRTEDGRSVCDVMVGGKFVVKNKELVNIDINKLRLQAENAVERLDKLNNKNELLFREIERLVGEFCVGLAKKDYHIHRYGSCEHHGCNRIQE